VFLSEFEKIRPSLEVSKDEGGEKSDKETIIAGLLDAVSNGNQALALKYTDELAALIGERDEIGEIRRCIKNIDFDKAEKIVIGIKR
jgi:hypothetical protein